jgi:predicted RNase H-like nuclease (RuvC/YqgF family)
MSMTPSEQKTHTPRTDEAFQEYWNGGFWSLGFHSFAKILETDLAAMSAEVDTLRASIAEKDEALRASLEHQVMDSRNRTWDELRNMQRRALSSTGSELMERLKKAEAERAEEWRKNRELRSENDTLRASLDDVNASRDRLGKALEELRGAISTFKGHGMPGFTDRALALIVIGETDAALAEWRGEK